MRHSSAPPKSSEAILEASALKLLLSNRVVSVSTQTKNEGAGVDDAGGPFGMQEEDNISLGTTAAAKDNDRSDEAAKTMGTQSVESHSYPAPCAVARTVQESTSTLLAARAYAKAGLSDYAWQALDALFAAQGKNGFLPKYRYREGDPRSSKLSPSGGNVALSPYVNGTALPNWPLFGHMPHDYLPHYADSSTGTPRMHGSGRVSATPFHGTAVLEIFYQSDGTTSDLEKLKQNFFRVYDYHYYLHETVMIGCKGGISASRKLTLTSDDGEGTPNDRPCYNILHPWESQIEPHSPLWNKALQSAIRKSTEEAWSVGFDVPSEVVDAFDHPNDAVYSSTLFLLECFSNATAAGCASHDEKRTSCDYESLLLSRCPFAMIDVGYAAALSKSDSDMLKIAKILTGKESLSETDLNMIDRLTAWEDQSNTVLSDLWSDRYKTFLSYTLSGDANDTVVDGVLEPLVAPVGDNFMACWDTKIARTKFYAMVFHLMQKSGIFSFSCGPFPLWSMGGCASKSTYVQDTSGFANKTRNQDPYVPSIYPMLNYFVALGMNRNSEVGVGLFLANSTFNLICGSQNTGSSHNGSCPMNASFAHAYDVTTNQPLSVSECGMTSTGSAAVVYDMIVPDKPFSLPPTEPPIRASWVIVLIAAELFVAFSIGVSCLVLSLNLRRRLKNNNEGDAFVRMIRSQQADTANLYGEDTVFSGASMESEGVTDDHDQESLGRRRAQGPDNENGAEPSFIRTVAETLNPLNYIVNRPRHPLTMADNATVLSMPNQNHAGYNE